MKGSAKSTMKGHIFKIQISFSCNFKSTSTSQVFWSLLESEKRYYSFIRIFFIVYFFTWDFIRGFLIFRTRLYATYFSHYICFRFKRSFILSVHLSATYFSRSIFFRFTKRFLFSAFFSSLAFLQYSIDFFRAAWVFVWVTLRVLYTLLQRVFHKCILKLRCSL